MITLRPKLLAVRSSNYEIQFFTHDETGATSAVGFLQEGTPPGGAIYRIEYYLHHAGTQNEEILPRSTKVGEM